MFKQKSLAALFSLLVLAMALPVFGQTAALGAAPTTPERKTFNVACVQNAIEKRDSALISAVDASASTVKAALQTRKDALKTAWAKTDAKERRIAIRDAWKAYATSSKKAREDLRRARQSAWQQFNTDHRACGAGAAGEDGTGAGADTHL